MGVIIDNVYIYKMCFMIGSIELVNYFKLIIYFFFFICNIEKCFKIFIVKTKR